MGSRAWVLACEQDLVSDFSVYHRIDDMYGLDVEEFFVKADRLGHYGGAVAAYIRTVVTDAVAGPVRTIEPDLSGYTPPALTDAQMLAMGGMQGMGGLT